MIENCAPLEYRVCSILKCPVLEGTIRWSGGQKNAIKSLSTPYASISKVANRDVAIHQPLSDHKQFWFLPQAVVPDGYLRIWLFLLSNRVSWQRPINSLFLFIFLLLLIKHRKGKDKWANFRILQLDRYPRRPLILLKSLYWLLDISSSFTLSFPYL